MRADTLMEGGHLSQVGTDQIRNLDAERQPQPEEVFTIKRHNTFIVWEDSMSPYSKKIVCRNIFYVSC